MRCTGEEVLDLVEQPVDVFASGEAQDVVSGLFEIAGAGDVVGEVAAVKRRVDAVAAAVNDQRRDLDGGQRGSHVDVAD